jgi:hypothetical protein
MDEVLVNTPAARRAAPTKCLLGVLLAAGACLAGCASKEPKADVEILDLVQMFPGHYDNTAQAQSDLARGVQPPHEALVLDIVPIEAIMIGDNVFYVQESIAGDPKRVLGQKVVMFGVVKKKIVQTDFSLAEPFRWRNGQFNPDLFKGIMTTDVRSTKGCSLRWKRNDAGNFEGSNDPKTCHSRARGSGGIAAIESRAELGPTEYATAEMAYDKGGHVTAGRQDESFYRFRKQSHDAD